MKARVNMTNAHRELIFKVCDGDYQILPFIHHICTHYPKHQRMLAWLISNKIVGKRFLDFINNDNEGSPLLAYAYILSRINHEKNRQQIIYGKDFVS